MNLTNHARKRMQQRAIPADFIELLTCFGVEISSHRGIEKLAMPIRQVKQIGRRIKALGNRWDQLMAAYVVVTAAHTYRRRTRNTRNTRNTRSSLITH